MWWSVILSFLSIIIGLIYWWYKTQFKFFENRGIPGPRPSFPFGNTPNGVTYRRNVVYDWDQIYRDFKGKTPFIGAFEMFTPKFMLIDPEMIKLVLIKNFKNFHDNEISKMGDKDSEPLFSRNPFMLTGNEWKEKRAEVTPAFTANRIKAMFPLIEEVVGKFKKYLNDNQNVSLESREICAKYTTDVVSSCLFNADAQSFTKEKPEIREMGKRLFNMSPTFLAIFTVYYFLPFLSKIHKLKFVPQDVEDFFINLMLQAVERREKDKIKRDDYLSYLISLRDKKQMSEIDMAAHGVNFFSDGFDSSSLAMCHVFYELASNKSVQSKLRVEIEKLFDANGNILYDKMQENEYLDQVFYETLRLHPPATIINRDCNEKLSIEDYKGKSHEILVGDSFYVPIYSIHRDPEYYPEPEKFKPERFDSEFGGIKAFRDKCVLLPFGDGPRICIGMKFAIMQSKSAIVSIIRDFEVSVDPKTQTPLEIATSEFLNAKQGGLWLNFKSIR